MTAAMMETVAAMGAATATMTTKTATASGCDDGGDATTKDGGGQCATTAADGMVWGRR